MQTTLHKGGRVTEFLAKQKREDALPRHLVPHFRHELASALAMLQSGDPDLAVYLAAAHHGKVRMSIRSMPSERELKPNQPIARGISESDLLPACDLMPGQHMPKVELFLAPMFLGRNDDRPPTWSELALKLRDEFGPFRLAYLEMLLRVADERASEKAKELACHD